MNTATAPDPYMRTTLRQIVLIGLLFAFGTAHTQEPYPRLAAQQRETAREFLQEMREELDEAVSDSGAEPMDVAEQLDARAEQTAFALLTALLDDRLDDASSQVDALEWQVAAIQRAQNGDDEDVATEMASHWTSLVPVFEASLSDAALRWIQTQVERNDEAAGRRDSLTMRMVMVGRALRRHDVAGAQALLLALQQDAQADCAKPEVSRDGRCGWLDTTVQSALSVTESLARIDQRRAAPATAGHRKLQLTSVPMQTSDQPQYICGFGRQWDRAAVMPDPINIAVAFGDLDTAIALALHENVLAPDVMIDARLPDLLLARYGETGLARELQSAAQRIEERELVNGRVVFTTLFGHELLLPSAILEETTRREYRTLAEHAQNLRSSALYQTINSSP